MDAPGQLSRRDHGRTCRRSWRRYVSVLQRPAEPRRPIFWCERLRIDGSSQKRDGTRICEGAVRAWPATASRPFHVPGSHGRTARSTVVQLAYGALTVLPPRARETLRQRAAEGVGHPCLGRADPRRRRAVGMDSVDLGVHDDARAGMPSASGGMNTAGSWKTITNVSKPGAISKSARCRAPSV